MKRFDTFGAYMFDLLFAPLKRGKQVANQFFIFFKVIGRIFDDMKKDVFRLRNEINVATASPAMLPVHGQDRDMLRLDGEDIEGYRTRLSMKGIISEWGGTRQGILYTLTALGYKESTIVPFSHLDPSRWAEFIVYLGHGSSTANKEFITIYNEIQQVKEASSKLAYFVFIDTPPLNGNLYFGSQITSYSSSLLNTSDSIVLVRDREFESVVAIGVVVSSYKEEVLVCDDELILVRDRIIEKEVSIAPIITSYKEEFVL